NCGNYKNITFNKQDAVKVDYSQSKVVISMFTLQFIPLRHRYPLVDKIYKELVNGGVFIVCEKTLSDDPVINHMYSDILLYDKREEFTPEEILNKAHSLRGVMTPLRLSDNITMFENAGFEIEIFHKDLQFTGYILTKKVL
ncbi:MAG: hypothetical protein ACRCRT_01480, partial [Cetobacterium somerae]